MWPRLHGALTHFPLALTMVAALCEGLSVFLPCSSSLRSTARTSLIIAALSAVPAALSGLFLTKGEALGHGPLLYHHLFVWPALAGLVVLAFCRDRGGEKPSRRAFYLAALGTLAALMAGAGYWGGEMILAPAEPVPPSPAQIDQGRQAFVMSCADCHGDDARGGEGPDLHGLAISDSRIGSTISQGIKGEMPAFGKKYDATQVAALIAYLRSLK